MKPRGVVISIAAAIALLLVAWIVYATRVDARREGTARAWGVEATRIPADVELAPVVFELTEAQSPADATRLAADVSNSDRPTEHVGVSPTPTNMLNGRVVDLAGLPVANVPVRPRDDPARDPVTSDAEGRFPLTPDVRDLVVADPRWYTLRDTEPIPHDGGAEVLVLVAPAIRIGGRVEDPDGAPIRGVEVQLELPAAVFATFPGLLDRALPVRDSVQDTSGTDGGFELEIPSVEHARLIVTASGWVGTTLDAPRESRFDVVVRLAARTPSLALRVAGEVVHADGTPGVGATVRYGRSSSTVDSAGRFELSVGHGYAEGQPLVAVLLGFQPAVVADFWTTVQLASGETLPFQHLVLGGPPLTIDGRLIDSEGHPQHGWQVEPIDPLILMEGGIPPETAEALVLGRQVAAQTDADGRFRLEGLLDRMYRLQAVSSTEFVRIESDPVPGGARNVQIVVPANAYFPEVQGVVVSADGSPIACVDVRFALIVFRTKSGFTMTNSKETQTDAAGHFRLTKVPRNSSKIDVTSDSILPASFDLADHVEGEHVRIVAARRCHARVEGVPADTKLTWFRVQDARGENLQLMQFQSGGWWSSDSVQFTDGTSPVFAVSESARTIVFQGDGVAEVARPIVPKPGEITVVRW